MGAGSTHARSQRFAEKRRCIARSSSSDFCVRYESIILPVVVVRSGEVEGWGVSVPPHRPPILALQRNEVIQRHH